MAQVNLADYKNSYIETARKSINSLHEQCNKLVNNAFDKETINDLHITSHSLKGRSQVMGFVDMAKMSEIIEKNSDDILNGVGKIDDSFLINLKDYINKLNLEFAQIEKGAV